MTVAGNTVSVWLICALLSERNEHCSLCKALTAGVQLLGHSWKYKIIQQQFNRKCSNKNWFYWLRTESGQSFYVQCYLIKRRGAVENVIIWSPFLAETVPASTAMSLQLLLLLQLRRMQQKKIIFRQRLTVERRRGRDRRITRAALMSPSIAPFMVPFQSKCDQFDGT